MFARLTTRSGDDLRRWSLLLSTVLVLAMMIALGGCNTIGGMGEDVEAAGDTMSDSAEDVEESM